eukprot:TRINITY_DN2890_c0_g1_i1.p1 TRINITY_DN2890_c0_g1~~TRINITY_DN2890_c0_g1_i1.p1  ORF type:complete len:118 (+),score=3.04 TRINITY_DN2890_c0_g1_i1:605-958(+)
MYRPTFGRFSSLVLNRYQLSSSVLIRNSPYSKHKSLSEDRRKLRPFWKRTPVKYACVVSQSPLTMRKPLTGPEEAKQQISLGRQTTKDEKEVKPDVKSVTSMNPQSFLTVSGRICKL